MKTFSAILLALLLSLPNLWAEPAEAAEEPPEKTEQPAEKTDAQEPSKKDQLLDKIFNKIKVEIDKEDELTDQEKAAITSDIKEAKEALKEVEEIKIDLGGNDTIMGSFITLTFVILVFGGPVLIVAIALYSSFKKRRLTHETINAYVQAGKDIPAEVLEGLQKQQDPKSNLHKGLVMVGVGLGIMGFFIMVDATEATGLGLIPLFIGLAQLLVWKLESKNGQDQ